MVLQWYLDNPAIALEKYFDDIKSFEKNKKTNEALKKELLFKEKELESIISQFNSFKSMDTYVEENIDSLIGIIQQNTKHKISEEEINYDLKKKQLLSEKEKQLFENDNLLNNHIKKFTENDPTANRELTDVEKETLNFEITRREFINKSNEKINKFEDAILKEDLDCKTVVGKLRENQKAINEKFEPSIRKYKEIIEDINKKHQPNIKKYQDILLEKVADKNEEIENLELQRDKEIQFAKSEIAEYQREYKKTDRQYSDQIRMAKLQNRPTVKMENSRVSRLNAINDQIEKVNSSTMKKVANINHEIEITSNKHEKRIKKAEIQLNTAIENRDQELAEPTKICNDFINDKNNQLSPIQVKISQKEKECSNKISVLNNHIKDEKDSQEQFNLKIDQQILDFVMNGDNCFSNVLNEANAPFLALQEKSDAWMNLLSTIKRKKFSNIYSEEHEKQKNILINKSYQELQNEILEANTFENSLSFLAQNSNVLTIVGGFLSGVGLIMLIILYIILKISIGMIGLFISALGIMLIILTLHKTNEEFSKICKYVSLALDYKDFPSISSHSKKITQDKELSNMKDIGGRLYDIYYGKIEAQKIHDSKAVDIEADYEKNFKLLSKEFEDLKAQIQREMNAEIEKVKDNQSKTSIINEEICNLKSNIAKNEEFINAFESNYQQLDKNLQDSNWRTPMEYTHGKLSNDLFIIVENQSTDDYGHKKIYKLNHNKKALVITYSINDLSNGDGSHIENIGKMINGLMFDLMYSIYRMNSHETYVQFIVDELICTNDFKSTNVKNAFNIVDVVGKIDDIRNRLKEFALQREKLAEKGISMDDINESKFNSQDRPSVYNILYIIFKPNERKSKLDDDIRMLIPDCNKYGFLPIFICEKNTWDKGIQEKESIYKDINSLINNPVIMFDGVKYTEIN